MNKIIAVPYFFAAHKHVHVLFKKYTNIGRGTLCNHICIVHTHSDELGELKDCMKIDTLDPVKEASWWTGDVKSRHYIHLQDSETSVGPHG